MSANLRSLSDSIILSRVRDLATRERKATLLLIIHLNEIERRRLHLKQGYSSMFDYCTSGLGYSEPAAVRRIRTARCIARFPEVYDLLKANEVSLSTIARVSRVLTAANKDALLARVRRRPQREVDAIVAEYEPRMALRDIVRPVVVPVRAAPPERPGLFAACARGSAGEAAAASALAGAAFESNIDDGTSNSAREKDAYRRCDGDLRPMTFATEKRVQFQFTTSEGFREKLEKVKALAWHRLPANPSLEAVFELLIDEFIATNDPRARLKSRERRTGRSETNAPTRPARTAQRADGTSRHVPAALRDKVFVRDEDRCRFVGANGKRCTSRSALQIDHVKPFARGGGIAEDNLRLLCAHHNRLEAERLMGPLARRPRGPSMPLRE